MNDPLPMNGNTPGAAKGFRKPVVSVDQIIEAIEVDDNIWFCIKCGAEQMGVEPDARKYPCESCGEKGVYGAEELLLHVQA